MMLQAQLESISRQRGEARLLAIQHLARQLGKNLESTLEELQPFLGTSDHPFKNLREVVVQVIRALGYPQNAGILPRVLEEFTDVNSPALKEVTRVLDDLDEEIASAYLLQLLWKHAFRYKESPYYPESERAYLEVLDSACGWISMEETKRAYAVAVAPLLVATNERWLKDTYIREVVLDTLEKIGPASGDYALPVLLQMAERERGSALGKRVWAFILAFSPEALAPYQFVLGEIRHDYPDAG